MAWDIILPNGTTIKGIPEGTTPDQVQQMAIQAGMAKASDFGAAAQPTLHDQIQKVAAMPQDADAEASGFGGGGKYSMSSWAQNPANVEALATATTNQDRMPTHKELTERADAAKLALFATGMGALPEMGLAAAIPTAGGVNALAGAVTNENETTDALKHDVLEGAIGEGAGRAIIHGTGAIAKPLLERFTTRAAVTAKAAEPVIDDILEGGTTAAGEAGTGAKAAPIKEAAPGDRMPTQAELLEARRIADLEADRNFATAAGHHQAAIEATSYFGKPMKQASTGAAGKSPHEALEIYRDATSGYINPDMPLAAEIAQNAGHEHLADVGQMEAILRSQNKPLDEAFAALDNGEVVEAAKLRDMLTGHRNNTAQDVVEALRNSPASYLDDLQQALKRTDLETIMEKRAWFNPDKEAVRAKTRADYEESLRDLYRGSGIIEKQLQAITDDIAAQTTAYKVAGQAGDIAKQTAIKYHKEMDETIAKSLEHFQETGDLPDLTEKEQAQMAMFFAQGRTHKGATQAVKIYEEFRQLQSVFNALPAAREDTAGEVFKDAAIGATLDYATRGAASKAGKAGKVLLTAAKKSGAGKAAAKRTRALVRKVKR